MGRDSERRKELQKAEYQNRKEGMATGRTEEERSTGGTAVRGEREEGKRKGGRLSSQNQRGAIDKKANRKGKARKRKQKGSTGIAAVGAKPGGTKGNKQKAEYEKPEGSTGNRVERKRKSREAERQRGST